MAGRAEDLYRQLQSAEAVLKLIGEPEDAHLDCKEWPVKEDDAQKMLAKAVCGMANADGGVLIIGMKAPSARGDEPDVITGAVPVSDRSLVRSKVLDLVGKIVEPGIVGLLVNEVPDTPGQASGFVIVYVPKNEGSPHRSRKDWKFYQRIGSSTLPMEYWQIEDAFGKRPHPKLGVTISEAPIGEDLYRPLIIRGLTLTVTNEGRGIARFPALILQRPLYFAPPFGLGIPPSKWPFVPTNDKLFSYRGGADNVIYPGESIDVAGLFQNGVGIEGVPHYGQQASRLMPWDFPGETLIMDVVCDGMPSRRYSFEIPSVRHIPLGCPYTVPPQ